MCVGDCVHVQVNVAMDLLWLEGVVVSSSAPSESHLVPPGLLDTPLYPPSMIPLSELRRGKDAKHFFSLCAVNRKKVPIIEE